MHTNACWELCIRPLAFNKHTPTGLLHKKLAFCEDFFKKPATAAGPTRSDIHADTVDEIMSDSDKHISRVVLNGFAQWEGSGMRS